MSDELIPALDESVSPVEVGPPTTVSILDTPREQDIEPGYHDKEMSLIEHLEELLWRALKSVAAWIIASFAVYYLVPQVMKLTKSMVGANTKLIFTSPTEAFFVYLKVAMIGGLFVALPVVAYQIIAFIAPGLKPKEKRWLLTLLPFSIILFFIGAAFAYCVVLPTAMRFFTSFAVDGVDAHLKLDDTLEFVTNLLGLCGIVFQLPLVFFALSLVGLITAKFLASQRRIAIFAAFVISAIATPTPDAFTCAIVALPIIMLYEISIWLIWMRERWAR